MIGQEKEKQERIKQMMSQTPASYTNIPQFDGLAEDDIVKLLDESDDDVKIEVDGSSDEETVEQLDGTADDDKDNRTTSEQPLAVPPGMSPKVEDVKIEPKPAGPILLHSTLGRTHPSPHAGHPKPYSHPGHPYRRLVTLGRRPPRPLLRLWKLLWKQEKL